MTMTRAHPLRKEIKATVIVQYFHDCHRSKQEHNDLRGFAYVFEKNILGYIFFDRHTCRDCACKEIRIFTRMLAHHEIRSIAYIQYPTYRPHEHSHSSLVHIGYVTRSNENITYYQYGDDNQCHYFTFNSHKVTKYYEITKNYDSFLYRFNGNLIDNVIYEQFKFPFEQYRYGKYYDGILDVFLYK